VSSERVGDLVENKVVVAIITMIVCGMISWTAWTTQKLSVQVAVIKDRVENMSVENFSTRASLLEQRVDRLESWTSRLSDRLADVEAYDRARKIKFDEEKKE
jgi:hypothetical protein